MAQIPASWTNPYPADKIAGNVYYVGTEDLAVFLITGQAGHILVNTRMANSTALIRKGIEELGLRFSDIKILLVTQAHVDHAAALAEVKKLAGAKLYATPKDAPILEAGEAPMPEGAKFAPVKVDRVLRDGEVITLGDIKIKAIFTPGHTPGSVSYSLTVRDGGRDLSFLIANMNTVVLPLFNNHWYPDIVKDFERSFRVQAALRPDIWVAAHASQYNLARKRQAGSFIDPSGYLKAVERHEKMFREQLKRGSNTPK